MTLGSMNRSMGHVEAGQSVAEIVCVCVCVCVFWEEGLRAAHFEGPPQQRYCAFRLGSSPLESFHAVRVIS